MKKYVISFSLIIILLFGFSSPSISRSNDNLQTLLVLYSSEDEIGMDIFNNTTNILQTNDISYAYYDISKSNTIPSLRSFTEVLISTETVYFLSLESKKDLTLYVKNGGKIVQLIRFYDKDMSDVYGIKSYTEVEPPSNGVKFNYNLSPGIMNISIPPEDSPSMSSYQYTLNSNVSIISQSFEGVPLAWEYQYGNGKTFFWNTTFLSEKDFRGLIISSITHLLDYSARKVYALGGLFIDDMPSPSWKVKWEPIKTEYDVTDSEYYYNILIPDLIVLAKKYNLKYTTAAIFAYTDKITPPFDFGEWNNSNLQIGNEIYRIPEEIIKVLKKNSDIFEIGFHGYNHIPFMISNWGNVNNMYSALRAAKEKWNETIGGDPLVYVPPMNTVDQVGFDATVSVFNSIKTFSSLYQETIDDGCDRDFGPELWNNEITAVPRLTSGYEIVDYDMFVTFSMLEAYGIWTHFLHPDDVFSTPGNFPGYDLDWIRNPLSLPWKGDKTGNNGLYYKFEDSLKKINESYPWLKYETISNVTKKIVEGYNDFDKRLVVTDYYMEFSNSMPETYVLEMPPYYDVDITNDFTVTSDMLYGNKRRIVVNVPKACKIYYKNA